MQVDNNPLQQAKIDFDAKLTRLISTLETTVFPNQGASRAA